MILTTRLVKDRPGAESRPSYFDVQFLVVVHAAALANAAVSGIDGGPAASRCAGPFLFRVLDDRAGATIRPASTLRILTGKSDLCRSSGTASPTPGK